MNREAANNLVRECLEDLAEFGEFGDSVAGHIFSALVAARLAPEPKESATHGRPVGLGPCEHGCENMTHGRFCSPECAECENGGPPCSPECAELKRDEPQDDRPSYVPEGAPWEWTVLANGERVAMWALGDVPDGRSRPARVRLHDPDDYTGAPWPFWSADEYDGTVSAERIGPTALAAVEAFGRLRGAWK